jgi:hypothetical protein
MHQVAVRRETVDRVLARRGHYHWLERLDPQLTALLVIVTLRPCRRRLAALRHDRHRASRNHCARRSRYHRVTIERRCGGVLPSGSGARRAAAGGRTVGAQRACPGSVADAAAHDGNRRARYGSLASGGACWCLWLATKPKAMVIPTGRGRRGCWPFQVIAHFSSCSQFSRRSPGICWNSRRLLVTTVRPSLRA